MYSIGGGMFQWILSPEIPKAARLRPEHVRVVTRSDPDVLKGTALFRLDPALAVQE
jgi:hypothetical protein